MSTSAQDFLQSLTGPTPRRALGRAITLLESTAPADREVADRLIDFIRTNPPERPTFRLGISGTPGVGKSTFIERFGLALIEAGRRVAILAVDPSSGISGGSILGDKTRMETLSRHPEAFIRPSPNAGRGGGVADGSRGAILLCEAAGYDYVIVETVGVGQADWEVHDMTDAFLLLTQPGSGDDLQGIKRGILELADHVVVNKADAFPQAAKRSALELRQSLHLAPARPDGWIVKTTLASGLTGAGIEDVIHRLAEFHDLLNKDDALFSKRQAQTLNWLAERARLDLTAAFDSFLGTGEKRRSYLTDQLAAQGSLDKAARAILAAFQRGEDRTSNDNPV